MITYNGNQYNIDLDPDYYVVYINHNDFDKEVSKYHHQGFDKVCIIKIKDEYIECILYFTYRKRHHNSKSAFMSFKKNFLKWETWWFNDQIHNWAGPAIIDHEHKTHEWLINGYRIENPIFNHWPLSESEQVEFKMLYTKNW